MSRPELPAGGSMRPNFEPNWEPIVQPLRRRCESCGATERRTIYLPNGVGGGRRLCPDCLRVFDALRAKEPAAHV